MPNLKDSLAMAAGKVTPGVDDTPYLQYAIEMLTRQRGSSPVRDYHLVSGTTDDSGAWNDPRQRQLDAEMGIPITPPSTAYAEDRDFYHYDEPESHPTTMPVQHSELPPFAPATLAKQPRQTTDTMPQFSTPTMPITNLARSTPVLFNPDANDSGHWVPVTKDMLRSIDPRETTYPLLTYKPSILRPFSMLILIAFGLVMAVGLIIAATYSSNHNGLTRYPGSIYSGKYFLFRILPQLLSGIILIYAQTVVAASMRVLPFVSMASEEPRRRYLALFQKLYPKTFLVPQIHGPWQFQAFSVATWLLLFTIPLQSTVFTCIYVDRLWVWAPVTGVIWTLVSIYLILIITTIILMIYWFGQWTGLTWDVRSIADLLPLLHRSNTLNTYEDINTLSTRQDRKSHLRDRWFDRLGYWRTQDMLTGGIWYTVGTPFTNAQSADGNEKPLGKNNRNLNSVTSRDLAVPTNLTLGRSEFRYLPFHLRTIPLLTSVAVAAALLLALLIVSFLPSTQIETGFRPLLTAQPTTATNFSPANFVYGFIPSLIGMILFLLFQTLDLSLRVLQPWGALADPNGTGARRSILADYAACMPFQSTYHAIRNGHWRVAATSILAVLFITLPILSGGLFMALTDHRDGVRMYPSTPVFGVILAFLLLYVLVLTILIPNRGQFLLPDGVDMTCLADIVSMCSSEELVSDASFRSVRNSDDLRTRLGAHPNAIEREESMWFLGTSAGKEERRVSVRRMRRFTEKWTKRTSRSMRSSTSMV